MLHCEAVPAYGNRFDFHLRLAKLGKDKNMLRSMYHVGEEQMPVLISLKLSEGSDKWILVRAMRFWEEDKRV